MNHTSQQPVESQLGLWSHFQNQRAVSFDASKDRLNALIRYAERSAGGRSLLNIGCGNGYLEAAAQKKNWKVVSVDPDRESVARLGSAGIDARCGVIQALPVPSESMDVVICTEVLEHIPCEHLSSGIAEIHRVLKPRGALIGTVPYRENLVDNEVYCTHCQHIFHRWGHQQSFDEDKMRSLLEACFELRVVRQKYFPSWTAPSWKTRLTSAARYAFSLVGIYGSNTNLFFVAAKRG